VAEARDSAKIAADEQGIAAPKPSMKDVLKGAWPIPALVVAMGLLGGGMWSAFSKRPKDDPSIPLKHAEQLVESGEYQEAIDELSGGALGFMDSGLATVEQQNRYYLSRARAFAGAQAKLGITREENHTQIVEDYKRVEELGGSGALEPADGSSLIESLIALGSVDESLRRIATLGDGGEHAGDEQRARKLRLTRLLVEHNLAAIKPEERRDDLTLDLLARMSTDPDLQPDDRAWVLARQSELLLSLDRVEDAITKLLRELQRMHGTDVPPKRQGELYVLLGRAYVESGQDQNATKQLEAAERLLGKDGGDLRADALVLMGRLAQRSGGGAKHEQARERYTLVVNEYKSSRAYLSAVLGMAEVEAAGREFDQSIERYQELVEAINKGEPVPPREADRQAVTLSLMSRWRELSEANEHDTALRFVQLAGGLYTGNMAAQTPPELYLASGRTNRRLADDQMAAARADHPADFTVRDLDPATRAEVKRQYLAAGDFYRRHAEKVSSDDTVAYSESLWISADSFDLAGDLEEARKVFSIYVDGAADNDASRPAAMFRLAQIFQAQGDHKAAISLYETLRTDSGDTQQPIAAGSWADRSVVPLALCYLADSDTENDASAEKLLAGVIDGQLIGPEAKDYRDALVELGNMYYAAGRYPDAIARSEEAVQRYGPAAGAEASAKPVPYLSMAKLGAVRFKLADSHRLEAGKIAATLQQALPQTVENELKASRIEHLRTAMRQYDQVRSELEALDDAGSAVGGSGSKSRMTELERTFLRNAFFYVGDCAFDLGDYKKAISAYDAAALKYVDDPSSLVAMVQIVNAYVAQGLSSQARTANERARRQLARFPDEVWNRPDLPMEKKHWERWLEARQSLEASAAAGG